MQARFFFKKNKNEFVNCAVGVDKDRNAKPAVDLEALCRHVCATLERHA